MASQRGAHLALDKQKRSWAFQPENTFAIVAALVLVVLTLFTPVGSNKDEFNHARRVEQICHGQVMPVWMTYAGNYPLETEKDRKNASVYGGECDVNLGNVLYENNVFLNQDKSRYVFPTWRDEKSQIEKRYGADGRQGFFFSNTAVNAPIVYLPYMPGFLLGSTLGLPIYWVVVLMRLGGAALYVGIVYWCIRCIPFGRWALTAFALLPSLLVTSSGVTADTVTNVLCIALVTQVLGFTMRDKDSWLDWLGIVLTCAFLPLAKVAYSPYLMLLLMPLANPRHRNVRSVVSLGCTGVLGLLILGVWYSVIGGINPGAMWQAGVNPSEQLSLVLARPLKYIRMLVSGICSSDLLLLHEFGIFNAAKDYAPQLAPLGFVGNLALLLGGMLLRDPRDRVNSEVVSQGGHICVLLFAAVAIICLCLVFTAVYLTFDVVGAEGFDGVTARYFVPIVPLVLFGVLVILYKLWSRFGGTRPMPIAVNAVTTTASILVIVAVELLLLAHMLMTVFI